jgi:hypothetical protein
MPPRAVPEGEEWLRLEFRLHLPHSVMVGKLVRAVSGFRAALVLAEIGYVAECGALLRMVSDFCTEVSAIGAHLSKGGEPSRAVKDFVEQYFTPRPRTPQEYAAAERTRYISREDLMKADMRLAEGTTVNAEQLRTIHRFLNVTYDAYVHGAYETTMELCDPSTGGFAMRGHPHPAKRDEFIEAAHLKLHEVVVAIELTAAATGEADVFKAAREARHAMDASAPWKYISGNDSA